MSHYVVILDENERDYYFLYHERWAFETKADIQQIRLWQGGSIPYPKPAKLEGDGEEFKIRNHRSGAEQVGKIYEITLGD